MATSTAFLLTIDGQQVETNMADFLPQQTPYPGGHSYQIQVTGEYASKLVSRLSAITSQMSREPTATEVLREVALVKRRLVSGEPDITWFLNTVEEFQVLTDVVLISGTCSEVVGR